MAYRDLIRFAPSVPARLWKLPSSGTKNNVLFLVQTELTAAYMVRIRRILSELPETTSHVARVPGSPRRPGEGSGDP